MALVFIDSFDHYLTADRLDKWTASGDGNVSFGGSIAIGAFGRHSSNGIRLHAAANTGNSGTMNKQGLTTSGNTVIIGFAFRPSALNGAMNLFESPQIIGILLGGTQQMSLKLSNSGAIEAVRGTGGSATSLGPASAATLSMNTYVFLEMKAVIAPGTGGSVEVKVNGTVFLSLTGINTAFSGTAGWNGINLGNIFSAGGSGGTAINYDYDDLYVCDASGTFCNDYLGDCRVDAGVPTAAGAKSEWGPSAGANFQCVDDATPNDDIDHNSTALVGKTDTFVMPNAPAGALIYGVQLNLTAKKLDSSPAALAPVAIIDGVEYVGPGSSPTTAYLDLRTMHMLSPATGLPWTEAEFNAAEIGYKSA